MYSRIRISLIWILLYMLDAAQNVMEYCCMIRWRWHRSDGTMTLYLRLGKRQHLVCCCLGSLNLALKSWNIWFSRPTSACVFWRPWSWPRTRHLDADLNVAACRAADTSWGLWMWVQSKYSLMHAAAAACFLKVHACTVLPVFKACTGTETQTGKFCWMLTLVTLILIKHWGCRDHD